MEIVEEHFYPWVGRDKITVTADVPKDILAEMREVNERALENLGYAFFNLAKADGLYDEAPGTGLTAKLPKDREIRAKLIDELKKRFGDRVVVFRDVVLIADNVRDLGYWTNRPNLDFCIVANKVDVIAAGEYTFDFSELGKDAEKIARFVLARPTNMRRRGENNFIASRKTSVGEFFVYGKDDIGTFRIRFDGFRPAK